MSIVQPRDPLHKIVETNDELTTHIPLKGMRSPNDIRVISFLGWLFLLFPIGWLVVTMILNVVRHYHFTDSFFFPLFAGVILIPFGILVLTLRTTLQHGVSEITITAHQIKIGLRTTKALKRAKVYRATHVLGLRVVDSPVVTTQGAIVLTNRIVFDYGSDTIGFGAGLNLSAGQEIVGAILTKFPHFGKLA